MFDVFEYAYMHLPCISEGACAIIAAEQSYTKSVKKKKADLTVNVESNVSRIIYPTCPLL